MISEGIIIALITGGMAIISNVIVAWAQNSKTIYRIDQLEKKVEKQEYVNKLKDDIQRLEYLVEAPLDDDFKIRIAREKLGMCFPDEIIFYGEYE